MWSVVEMQSITSHIKEWGWTLLGLGCLAFISIFSISLVYAPYIFSTTPQLNAVDKATLASINPHVSSSPVSHPVTTKPKRLLLPSIDLGIDIDDATIDIHTNTWPLSNTNAQYANFTSRLGSKRGTMLLYGHNTWQVMRKTGDLKIGDEMVLLDENGQEWKFRFDHSESVIPENVGFIYEDVPFRVVAFTCDGWNDQYRRLMYFEPVTK
jgi:hypothetical protein